MCSGRCSSSRRRRTGRETEGRSVAVVAALPQLEVILQALPKDLTGHAQSHRRCKPPTLRARRPCTAGTPSLNRLSMPGRPPQRQLGADSCNGGRSPSVAAPSSDPKKGCGSIVLEEGDHCPDKKTLVLPLRQQHTKPKKNITDATTTKEQMASSFHISTEANCRPTVARLASPVPIERRQNSCSRRAKSSLCSSAFTVPPPMAMHFPTTPLNSQLIPQRRRQLSYDFTALWAASTRSVEKNDVGLTTSPTRRWPPRALGVRRVSCCRRHPGGTRRR